MRHKTIAQGLLVALITLSSSLYAQNHVYTKAENLTLIGKAKPIDQYYHRVDTAKYNDMPAPVKALFTNSSGLGVVFKTNSKSISAKWSVKSPRAASNLLPIMQKGLDLYIKRDGKWEFAGVARPYANKTDHKGTMISNMVEGEKECLLYFPLYDEATSVEVGVEPEASISAIPDPFHKKVIIYGSSILQGASASRPGLAYPSRMARETGINFINLGLSGNGKMDKPVVDMIAEIEDADAFILDCVPNTNAKLIKERAVNMVNTIRKAHPGKPIIIIETAIRETGNFDTKIAKNVADQNKAIAAEYAKMKDIKDLYYIKEANFLGTDHEGTADGTHPNDLGFDRMLSVIKPQILSILAKYNIK